MAPPGLLGMNFGHKLPKGQGLEGTGLWPHSFALWDTTVSSPAPHLAAPHPAIVPWAQRTFGLPGPQLGLRGRGMAELMTTASKQCPASFNPGPGCSPGCSCAFPCPHWGDHRVGETPITPHYPHHRSHGRCPCAPRAVHAVSCQGSHPRHPTLIYLFTRLFIYFTLGVCGRGQARSLAKPPRTSHHLQRKVLAVQTCTVFYVMSM